ncbi:hypothetical protein SAMN05216464_12212 [Mucilaginibacter pineti]|uniref:Uncharacterized protein n=1 Tax=Mucilaginibacter pineti TaxID=1391627 RepID=A0A1G7MMX9_9SPHI|nr:hypothetical protein [Mucilaginibacter pineti]SDF62480.1 hypothetical protein SAMN05216464_12212 [Mucilaginibacter pineti]
MRDILVQALHIFVVLMIGGFFIFGLMAINGRFDHWTTRFVEKAKHLFSRIRRYFQRNRKRKELQHIDEYQNVRHDHTANHATHTKGNKEIN